MPSSWPPLTQHGQLRLLLSLAPLLPHPIGAELLVLPHAHHVASLLHAQPSSYSCSKTHGKPSLTTPQPWREASCCCGLCTPEPISLCDRELRCTPGACGPRAQYQSCEQLVQLESICSNGSHGSSDGAKSAGPGGGSVHGP